MADTRERILTAALHLFARDGYEAVSVSAIAGELGMTKGALYKHYRNKRDIFDSIVERMYQIDAQRSREYEVPELGYEDAPEAYQAVSVGQVGAFTRAQFAFWTEDCFAADFRRMLTLEQYRSDEMAQLYSNCLAYGPVGYVADIFRGMMDRGILRKADPELLALEFYAPMYLLINASDCGEAHERAAKMLDCHIERFFRQNMIGEEAI